MNKSTRMIQLLKLFRNVLIGIAIAMLISYISFGAAIEKRLNSPMLFQVLLFVVMVVTVLFVLFYEWRYGDADRYLKDAHCQVSDAGYYLTARKQESPAGYVNAVKEDLAESGYRVSEQIRCGDVTFSYYCQKAYEYFYAATFDDVSGRVVEEYMNAALCDLTDTHFKRKGEGVVLFVGYHLDGSAIDISKDFERRQFGRRKTMTVYPVLVELSSRRVYFLGNKVCRAQKMAVNYVLNCELPLKPEYIGQEKLACQNALSKSLASFDIKRFRNDNKKG